MNEQFWNDGRCIGEKQEEKQREKKEEEGELQLSNCPWRQEYLIRQVHLGQEHHESSVLLSVYYEWLLQYHQLLVDFLRL